MSRSEITQQTNGVRRGHSAPVSRTRANRSAPACYEPYLDGLFTYCLSVLCEHDAAAVALGEVLALAERRRVRLRDPGLRRPWLYALARWACVRRLADGVPRPSGAAPAVVAERHRELCSLAWPEAAGITPEQREALELAVRHRLPPREVAHVLGRGESAVRELLARAACEVERARAARAVVGLGTCPAAARLGGGDRTPCELVTHVDDCPYCRRTAERMVAEDPWPGSTDAVVLPLVTAPPAAVCTGLLRALRDGVGRTREATPRFDRHGFPMDFQDRVSRRAVLRRRAARTTVVAAVLAAPVLALWATYRGVPLSPAGEQESASVSAVGQEKRDEYPYQAEDLAEERPRASRSSGAPRTTATPGKSSPRAGPVTPAPMSPSPRPSPTDAGRVPSAAGRLTVTTESDGDGTVVTLRVSGGSPVRWSVSTSAHWLRLTSTGGELGPGESLTVIVSADPGTEPEGPWSARLVFDPAGAVVTARGSGEPRPGPTPAEPPPYGQTPGQSPSPPPGQEPAAPPASGPAPAEPG